jgi:hypothetical protein
MQEHVRHNVRILTLAAASLLAFTLEAGAEERSDTEISLGWRPSLHRIRFEGPGGGRIRGEEDWSTNGWRASLRHRAADHVEIQSVFEYWERNIDLDGGPGGFGGHRINWRAFAAFPFALGDGDADGKDSADWRIAPEIGLLYLANTGGYGSAFHLPNQQHLGFMAGVSVARKLSDEGNVIGAKIQLAVLPWDIHSSRTLGDLEDDASEIRAEVWYGHKLTEKIGLDLRYIFTHDMFSYNEGQTGSLFWNEIDHGFTVGIVMGF